ncbi:hypothetical protein [Methylobacter sp. S3L5C]|uniref:hypothetical protein n=1 Tax=Methylobacter sp. S3L5C TaxID=2839024 RepID=UPI001FAD126A|nr:hypothetical protein [Methylobacter sp. S3L5C]UOA09563.1 hypothetical protein KKZ03_04530 [Methylobacter sp. S3L5C]
MKIFLIGAGWLSLAELPILVSLLSLHLIPVFGRKPFGKSIQRLVLLLQPLALPGLA